MGSAVILEQNWKSEQVRPGLRPPMALLRESSVTRKEAESGKGLAKTVSEDHLEVDPVFGI